MAEQKVQSTKKIVKKKFFDVGVPLTATKVKLYAPSEEALHGQTIHIDMTKNLKGKNLELCAKVRYADGKLDSEVVSMILIPSYIRRVMRRGIDYVEDSFITQTKDAKIRVKPFMITRKRVSRNVRKEIRNDARHFIETYAKMKTVREVFSDIMTNKLQKGMSLKVKKIYPLAFAEIRWIEVIPESDQVKSAVAPSEVKTKE